MFFSNRHLSYSRIYFFLVDKWLLQQISSFSIYDITWSDYAAISIVVEEKDIGPKVFMWLCNNVIIQDSDNFGSLSKLMREFFSTNATSI